MPFSPSCSERGKGGGRDGQVDVRMPGKSLSQGELHAYCLSASLTRSSSATVPCELSTNDLHGGSEAVHIVMQLSASATPPQRRRLWLGGRSPILSVCQGSLDNMMLRQGYWRIRQCGGAGWRIAVCIACENGRTCPKVAGHRVFESKSREGEDNLKRVNKQKASVKLLEMVNISNTAVSGDKLLFMQSYIVAISI